MKSMTAIEHLEKRKQYYRVKLRDIMVLVDQDVSKQSITERKNGYQNEADFTELTEKLKKYSIPLDPVTIEDEDDSPSTTDNFCNNLIQSKH